VRPPGIIYIKLRLLLHRILSLFGDLENYFAQLTAENSSCKHKKHINLVIVFRKFLFAKFKKSL